MKSVRHKPNKDCHWKNNSSASYGYFAMRTSAVRFVDNVKLVSNSDISA